MIPSFQTEFTHPLQGEIPRFFIVDVPQQIMGVHIVSLLDTGQERVADIGVQGLYNNTEEEDCTARSACFPPEDIKRCASCIRAQDYSYTARLPPT